MTSTRLFKFVCPPGEESAVRSAVGGVPETLGEGDDAMRVAAYFRGSGLFLAFRGPEGADPFDALGKDAKGKQLLKKLQDALSFDPKEASEFEIARVWPRRLRAVVTKEAKA